MPGPMLIWLVPPVAELPLPASFSPTANDGSSPTLLAATLSVPELTSRVVTLKSAPFASRPVAWRNWASDRLSRSRPVPGLAAKTVAVIAAVLFAGC